MKVAKFELALFGVNSYIVYDPESRCCAIIDPGIIDEEERSAIANFIERNNLKLTQIINTHMHIDHAIGNATLKNLYHVDVAASLADAALGQRMKEQAQMFGIPLKVEDTAIDTPLADGDEIKIGNGTLTVIATPGHSPGGICLYDKADGFLISGDTLFNGSIGRTDLPGGNHSQLIKSVKEKLLALPDNTIVYPGHGPATTIANERRHNPFLA